MPRRPRIVAIVNITEDSFSDGGRYLAAAAALDHARACVRAGANVIELGPASSHPDATRVPPDEQIEAALRGQKGKVASAARALGLSRQQMYRWLDKAGRKADDYRE